MANIFLHHLCAHCSFLSDKMQHKNLIFFCTLTKGVEGMEVFGPPPPLPPPQRVPQRSNVPSRRPIGPVFGRSPKSISPPRRLLRPLQPNRSSANRFPDPSAPAGGSAIAPLRLPPPAICMHRPPPTPPKTTEAPTHRSGVECRWGLGCVLGRVDESAGVVFF